jgi:hypothetical protein
MALLNQNGEVEFPYSKENVFEAICRAVPIISGMKIDTADKLTGRITVKANITLWSFGEAILIQLSSPADDKTKVQITSGSKFGVLTDLFDMGKNRKNVERILSGTSAILSQVSSTESHSQTNSSSKNSVADEIQKLKKLFDDGVLTKEEFLQQKTRLLN